jgi:hypothetical protein
MQEHGQLIAKAWGLTHVDSFLTWLWYECWGTYINVPCACTRYHPVACSVVGFFNLCSLYIFLHSWGDGFAVVRTVTGFAIHRLKCYCLGFANYYSWLRSPEKLLLELLQVDLNVTHFADLAGFAARQEMQRPCCYSEPFRAALGFWISRSVPTRSSRAGDAQVSKLLNHTRLTHVKVALAKTPVISYQRTALQIYKVRWLAVFI